MAVKKKNELAKTASAETLALLRTEFPTEPSFNRIQLPRLGMFSQDKTEGKGKAKKVVTEAGTFYVETQDEEETKQEDGTMKREFTKEELGDTIQGIILFERKQLKMFADDEYTSSTIYDEETDVVKLFCNKSEIASGTPKELQSQYMTEVTKSGKPKSALEETRILYILFEVEGEYVLHQMNLRGSSMYSYLDYKKKTTPNTVLTEFSSEYKEQGSLEWNQMTFKPVRSITEEEAVEHVVPTIKDLKEGIAQEKAFFAKKQAEDDEFENYGKEDKDEEEFAEEDLPALGEGNVKKKK